MSRGIFPVTAGVRIAIAWWLKCLVNWNEGTVGSDNMS